MCSCVKKKRMILNSGDLEIITEDLEIITEDASLKTWLFLSSLSDGISTIASVLEGLISV